MSPGPVRLIATDLDGTLLRPDSSISTRTVDALAAAADAGIHVVAATGRGWRSAVPLLAPLPMLRYAVCSNGSQTRDLWSEATVEEHALGGDVLEVILSVVDEALPDRGIFWERADGVGFDAAYARIRDARLRALGRPTGRSIEPSGRPPAGDGVLKVLVNHPTLGERELLDLLVPRLPAGTMGSTSGGNLLEITGAGVHKAAALDRLCGRLDVDPAEVVAFGDNVNDLQMLAWAGRSVAMANAGPDVQAAADETTAANDDDGVAVVVETLLAELH